MITWILGLALAQDPPVGARVAISTEAVLFASETSTESVTLDEDYGGVGIAADLIEIGEHRLHVRIATSDPNACGVRPQVFEVIDLQPWIDKETLRPIVVRHTVVDVGGSPWEIAVGAPARVEGERTAVGLDDYGLEVRLPIPTVNLGWWTTTPEVLPDTGDRAGRLRLHRFDVSLPDGTPVSRGSLYSDEPLPQSARETVRIADRCVIGDVLLNPPGPGGPTILTMWMPASLAPLEPRRQESPSTWQDFRSRVQGQTAWATSESPPELGAVQPGAVVTSPSGTPWGTLRVALAVFPDKYVAIYDAADGGRVLSPPRCHTTVHHSFPVCLARGDQPWLADGVPVGAALLPQDTPAFTPEVSVGTLRVVGPLSPEVARVGALLAAPGLAACRHGRKQGAVHVAIDLGLGTRVGITQQQGDLRVDPECVADAFAASDYPSFPEGMTAHIDLTLEYASLPVAR